MNYKKYKYHCKPELSCLLLLALSSNISYDLGLFEYEINAFRMKFENKIYKKYILEIL